MHTRANSLDEPKPAYQRFGRSLSNTGKVGMFENIFVIHNVIFGIGQNK